LNLQRDVAIKVPARGPGHGTHPASQCIAGI
jgi:hypothetical protein